MARHFAKTDEFPEVTAWMERITSREAFKASLPGPDAMLLYTKDFYEAWDV
jgi:glutathione S-transferase